MLSSPQFQSALSAFHSGLTSGQLGPLMSQFGLGEGVAQSAASGGESVCREGGMEERERKRFGCSSYVFKSSVILTRLLCIFPCVY